MKVRFCLTLLSAIIASVLLTSCDSKNPLSDAKDAKLDTRLLGTWRHESGGNTEYYHLGKAGGKLPAGAMRAVTVTHSKDSSLSEPGELLAFATTLGDKSYLNVTNGSAERMKEFEKRGIGPETADTYFILKYRIDDNVLLLWPLDTNAKKQAIESGKIKGVVEKDRFTTARFTDTTENVQRLISSAGDSLFAKEPLRFERIK